MQFKNMLCPETVKKIVKSLYLACLPAIAVAGISILESVTIEEGVFATLWAYFLPVIINAIKEYVSGVEKTNLPE